jgi:hypothetical protein
MTDTHKQARKIAGQAVKDFKAGRVVTYSIRPGYEVTLRAVTTRS